MSNLDAGLADSFRLAMRGLAASVTIISTERAHIRYGMVATAAMSVSMDPPSMVVAINKSASIHEPLQERRAFAINILSEWDHATVRGFAKANGESRFANGPWSVEPAAEGKRPLPFLANSLASILCEITDIFPSGTHSLFVGRVYNVMRGEDLAPLIYCDGGYGRFDPLPGRPPPARARRGAPDLNELLPLSPATPG